MANKTQMAQNQRILYDDAVANNMFKSAVPSFEEFQKRLEGEGYQNLVFSNYRNHHVNGDGFRNINDFRGTFGGSAYTDEAKAAMSASANYAVASADAAIKGKQRYTAERQRQKEANDLSLKKPSLFQKAIDKQVNNPIKNDNLVPVMGFDGKLTYLTSDGEEIDNAYDAAQYQNSLDRQDKAYSQAVQHGEIPSALDVVDKNGNVAPFEDIEKGSATITDEGKQTMYLKRLEYARQRKKEIEAQIEAENKKNGKTRWTPPSYEASIGHYDRPKDSGHLNDVLRQIDKEIQSLETITGNRTAGATALAIANIIGDPSDSGNLKHKKISDLKYDFSSLANVGNSIAKAGYELYTGLSNTAGNINNWTFGVADLNEAANLTAIRTKINRNEPLTENESMFLKSKLAADNAAGVESDEMSWIHSAAQVAGVSAPFMLDFLITGGYSAIAQGTAKLTTRGIAKATASFVSKDVAKATAKKVLASKLTKFTGYVAGDVASAAAMATTEQAAKTAADIMNRYNGQLYQDENGNYRFGTFDDSGNLLHEGGEKFGTAVYKGIAAATIENYTEKVFGHDYGIRNAAAKWLYNKGFTRTGAMLRAMGTKGWYADTQKFLDKFGLQSYPEEVAEEYIGIPLNAAFVGDNSLSDFTDAENNVNIWLGIGFSIGGMSAIPIAARGVKRGYNMAQFHRFKHRVDIADAAANNAFGTTEDGQQQWQDIKSQMDGMSQDKLAGYLSSLLRGNLTDEQKDAIAKYAGSLVMMRGYNVVQSQKDKANEATNTKPDADDQRETDSDVAYSEGRNATDDRKHDLAVNYNYEAQQLASMLGITEEQLQDMEDSELESMMGQNDDLDLAISAYQTADAAMHGVFDQAQDEIELAKQQAGYDVDHRTDKKRGTIRHATIKGVNGQQNHEVYVISGDIAANPDGTIDVRNSDNMILYFDPTTNTVEHGDATRFSELGEEVDAVAEREDAVNTAEDEATKKHIGIIDGEIAEGMSFPITDSEGQEHTYQVLSVNEDGTATISIDGNQTQQPVSVEDLQRLKDEDENRRVAEYKAQRRQAETNGQQPTEDNSTSISEDVPPTAIVPIDEIINQNNGDIQEVRALDKDGNDLYPDKSVYLVEQNGNKCKVVTVEADGTTKPHLVSIGQIKAVGTFAVDDFRQYQQDTVAAAQQRSANVGSQEQEQANNNTGVIPPTEDSQQLASAPTFRDGTPIPTLEDGYTPDLDNMDAVHAAEWYADNFEDDTEAILSDMVEQKKKALDKAKAQKARYNPDVAKMTAANNARKQAIADAQQAYDKALAIQQAYAENQLNTQLQDKSFRQSYVRQALDRASRAMAKTKDNAERNRIWNSIVVPAIQRAYGDRAYDILDSEPNTLEEFISSMLTPHSLNFEGKGRFNGVAQELGWKRGIGSDYDSSPFNYLFAKKGEGMTIDQFVDFLWNNLPSQLSGYETHDIRNALLDLFQSSSSAKDMIDYTINHRLQQAEKDMQAEQDAYENAEYHRQQQAQEEQALQSPQSSQEASANGIEMPAETPQAPSTQEQVPQSPSSHDQSQPEDLPFAPPLADDDVPFSLSHNANIGGAIFNPSDIVTDMSVVDAIVGKSIRKAFQKLAKLMGVDITFVRTANANAWVQDHHVYISLASALEYGGFFHGAQFLFGHEMVHEMKKLDADIYQQLYDTAKSNLSTETWAEQVDLRKQTYAGLSGYNTDADFEEEVVADWIGHWMRNQELVGKLAFQFSHPVLSALKSALAKVVNAVTDSPLDAAIRSVNDIITDAYDATINKKNGNQQQSQDGSARMSLSRVDHQGNPINEDGTLKLEKVASIDDITDEDFLNPTRNIELPTLPNKVSDVIGGKGQPLVIKKNIFVKNKEKHKDLTPVQSREILTNALYNPSLYGQNQKHTRPFNWILVHEANKHSAIIIEVNHKKDNVEIVNWHYLREETLEQKKKQAIKEGSQILTLESVAGNALNSLSFGTNVDNSSDTTKFSIKNFNNNTESPKGTQEGSSPLPSELRSAQQSGDLPYYSGEAQGAKFSLVTDKSLLKRIREGEMVKMYSSVQVIDGKYYSPMAAVIDGKLTDEILPGVTLMADEHPELVDKNGNFLLVKKQGDKGYGEGDVAAKYNPYNHTSDSMMNDQFTGAYARGNIVTAEWDIPQFDLDEHYHAEKAKDATGIVPWHSGSVNAMLPQDRQRNVALSRYRTMRRIVPIEEKADFIAEKLKGTDLALPWNTETPAVIEELAKRGVPISTIETGTQSAEVKEQFMQQMKDLQAKYPQAVFVNTPMVKLAYPLWSKDWQASHTEQQLSTARRKFIQSLTDKKTSPLSQEEAERKADEIAKAGRIETTTYDAAKFSIKSPLTMSDEELKERGDKLANAEAIKVESNQFVKTETMSARKAAENWWQENVGAPLFFDTEIGRVEINDNSIKDSLAHRYSQAKLDAITSLPKGFGNAVYLGSMSDFVRTRDNVLSHYFAYPITYNGKRSYVFCRAMQDSNKNRLYVHEVFMVDNIKKGNTLQTAASKPHGGIALYKDIIANVLDAANIDNSSDVAKDNSENSSDAAKYSIPTYHGSQADFDHFDHSFMGSGEGAQAYGWGTYVSASKSIAQGYAKKNAVKHSDRNKLRWKLVDKEWDLASFEVRYEVVLKDIDYETKNKKKKQDLLIEEQKEISRLKETYGENSQAVQDSEKLISHLHSVISRAENTLISLTEETKQLKDKQAECKKEIAVLKKKLKNFPMPERNLYDVDIPDDTGDNYLGWDSEITPDLQKRLGKMLVDNGFAKHSDKSYTLGEHGVDLFAKDDYTYETLGEFYSQLTNALGSQKAASLALSKAGFTGIKVIANRNRGGNDKGLYNYVIFNEADAQITDHIKFSLNGKPYDYDRYPLGMAAPHLANQSVRIVNAPKEHGFKNYADAKQWAKDNIVKVYDSKETGGKGTVRISNTAISKFLSESAVGKSDTKDAHLSVLKVLPDVLRESVYAETHPDFQKNEDGNRKPENGINKDILVHRCYGAVSIDVKPYRVKVTLKENVKTKEEVNAYSYEATKIELLAGQHGDVTRTSPRYSNNSINAAKLLQNVEMSYNKGKKLLEESEKMSEPSSFDEFLDHPSVRFSISTPEQRKAAQAAYDHAEKHRPDQFHQYALVDMDNANKLPEYYEKKQLADQWRKYFDKIKLGNYKLFDLEKTFEQNITNVKGRVPEDFGTTAEANANSQQQQAAILSELTPLAKEMLLETGNTKDGLLQLKLMVRNFPEAQMDDDDRNLKSFLSKHTADEILSAINAENMAADTKYSLTPLLNVDGKPILLQEDNGTIEMNYRSWQKEKGQVRDVLISDAGLDEDEADALMAQANSVAQAVKAFMEKYPRFRDFQNMEPTSRPIIRDNGDYISFDYSFNCIKKDALNAVVNKLVSIGKSGHLGVTQMEAIKRILQRHGFLTPCVMCYVEGKRKVLKQSKQDQVRWNAVRQAAGLEDKLMGEPTALTAEQQAILEELAQGKGLNRVENYTTKEDGITADTIKKIAKLMLGSDLLRGNMNYEWLMSPSSFTQMYDKFGSTGLMEYLSQGQYRGKQLLEASPFSINAIPRDTYLKLYSQLELKERGGIRQFSYEDARAMMFFDYYQQFLLMQGSKAPEHLYTKRPFMPEMFGLTGVMMNQSLIVDVWKGEAWHQKALGLSDTEYTQWLKDNAGFIPKGALAKDNADYKEGSTDLVPAWSVESFPVDTAMANAHNKAYKGTIGNTVVAPSVKFITWALDNPDIHMVLAYHATGASPIMKSLTGYNLAMAMDDGYHTLDANGKSVSELEVPEIGLQISGKTLQWNRLYRHNGFDAKKAAGAYLDYCKQNGLTPMFPYPGVIDHENYYKLLTDFRMYDEDGKSIRQRSVKATLPDNWTEVLDKYLRQENSDYQNTTALTLNDDIMREINAATKYTSIEMDERNTITSILKSIYGAKNVQVLPTTEFDKALDADTEQGRAQTLRDSGGMVYGYAVANKMVINEDVFNANTPLHEHAHIYMTVLKAYNPRLYAQGMELWRDTPQWNEAKADLSNLNEDVTDDRIFSECMARFTGAENEDIIAKVTGITDRKWLQKAMDWLKDMWTGIRSAFEKWTKRDLDNITQEQFARMPLRAFYDEQERKKYIKALNALVEAGSIDYDASLSMHHDEGTNGKVKMSAKKRRALETVSVLHVEEHQPTVVSSADGAKILKELDNTKEKYENQSSRVNTFLGDIAKALGAKRYGSASEYATFETKNGRIVTIRLANHNAKVSNFDHSGESDGISVVVSPKKSEGIINDGSAHVVEYYYDAIKLRRADGKPLADIVRSIKQALYSGEFNDVTGLAERQEVNGNDNPIRFSLRREEYDKALADWKRDNNIPQDAVKPQPPTQYPNESVADFQKRMIEYRKQAVLWTTAPTYEGHLLNSATAQGIFNAEMQRDFIVKRITYQDSMLPIRIAQEAIMRERKINSISDAENVYTAENRSHGKAKNEMEEFNQVYMSPLRDAYNTMMKLLGNSYDNVKIYMMSKHGIERNAHIAFREALKTDFDGDADAQKKAYEDYRNDILTVDNNISLELGKIDFATWRNTDDMLRQKYSPSYLDKRYDQKNKIRDYSGLSALYPDSYDFEIEAYSNVRNIEQQYPAQAKALWDATNDATKKILHDSYKAGIMSKDSYEYVRDMYQNYIPLRGWNETQADQVWDYIRGGKGNFSQTLKVAEGRKSIADDPVAYIWNMAQSGILINNKNWVRQHLMLLAENQPTSLLTMSKAWYIKTKDAQGNEVWQPASPGITSSMDSAQVEKALEQFEKRMQQEEKKGNASQRRGYLDIYYPQTKTEEHEHEVRVLKDGQEYVVYINGDPNLAQAINNSRATMVRQGLEQDHFSSACAKVGRWLSAAYTSLSPTFIPSNYFRDLTMTLASTAIREDKRYNFLLRKNLLLHWGMLGYVRDFQSGSLRKKVEDGTASKIEQHFYDFMMNGGETGFVSSFDIEDLKKHFRNQLKDANRLWYDPRKAGHIVMDCIETLNRAIEDSNRFAIYLTSIQYGRTIEQAVNDAKDVTLNFNRKGTGEHGWQNIRNMFIFVNPAVQSLQTMGALWQDNPHKFSAVSALWITSGLLASMANVVLFSLFGNIGGGDDDDDFNPAKEYWKFSKFDRRNNFILWVPFTHAFVKIPLAQEFRSFYALGDMVASFWLAPDDARETFEEYAADLLGTITSYFPIDLTNYESDNFMTHFINLMPNALQPLFALAANVDFTGKPIYKESDYNKFVPNYQRAFAGTPDWLVRMSKWTNSIGNDYPEAQQNWLDRTGVNNPAAVNYLLSSYLGGTYDVASKGIGLITKTLNGEDNHQRALGSSQEDTSVKLADIPFFNRFLANPSDRAQAKKGKKDEYYDMLERHDRSASTLRLLRKQAKDTGDYSLLQSFYLSKDYLQYKADDDKIKAQKKEEARLQAEETGEPYDEPKLAPDRVYKQHSQPQDEYQDYVISHLYSQFKAYADHRDNLASKSSKNAYYQAHKREIYAATSAEKIRKRITNEKKQLVNNGKPHYSAEQMDTIRKYRNKLYNMLLRTDKQLRSQDSQ